MQEKVFVLSPLTAQIYGCKHDKEYIHSQKTGLFTISPPGWQPGANDNRKTETIKMRGKKKILPPLIASQSL